MNILITGSNGFIAKNLISHIQERENINLILFDKQTDFSVIENSIKDIDIIFHLAGINRPTKAQEFYEGNTDFTKKLVDLVNKYNPKVKFVITSSIQAELYNDYGKSKKMAEEYILSNVKNYYIFRLHNVFGKWCKPNYNSVIATFCYNIANDLEITINDKNTELEMIYIDDVCKELIKVLDGNYDIEKKDYFYYVNPRYKVTLGYIVDKLYEFKNDMNSIYVPNTGDEFIKKLFATYVSYLPLDKMAFATTKNVDERGSFTELVRTIDSGQFSISFSKPGVIRGNHYHHTKMERFIVVKGRAKISFQSILNNDCYEFYVDDSDIKIITIPVGYSHKIENIGDDEMILVMWCNELFDKNHPDTFYKEVNLNNNEK